MAETAPPLRRFTGDAFSSRRRSWRSSSAPLVAVAIASTSLFRAGGRVLEIEMRASSGNAAQLYWSADYAFSGSALASSSMHQDPGEFDRLRFPLPDGRSRCSASIR